MRFFTRPRMAPACVKLSFALWYVKGNQARYSGPYMGMTVGTRLVLLRSCYVYVFSADPSNSEEP